MPPHTVRRRLAALSTVALLGVSIVGLTSWPAAAEPSPAASTSAPPTAASTTTASTAPVTTTAVPTASVPTTSVPITVPSTTSPTTPTKVSATRAATPAATSGPNLSRAVHYLATTTTTGADGAAGTTLAKDGYYESFPTFADFGLTIDGAFALAATGIDDPDLRTVVDVFRGDSADGAGNTPDSWTGIGTSFASGGSIGKEAVLAEVTGYDPRTFGGHDLIAALDHLICRAATGAPNFDCAGAGDYEYATSTFSQALGVIAQLRAGDATGASRAITYLESLQNQAGAWPSLLPSSGDSDVDSTAMAAMALALLPHDVTATAAVSRALAWIAAGQHADGGFTGTAGESANSTGLAVQGLSLAGAKYGSAVARARHFLAGQQNSDGGFQPSTTAPPGSDVRASTQAVSGSVATSFGTLSDDIAHSAAAPTSTSGSRTVSASSTASPSRVTATATSPTSTPAVVAGPVALASTGLNTTGLFAYALALLLAGAALLVLGRRRPATVTGRHR